MACDNPPEWALKRADELMRGDLHYRAAFARYIAANEQPPVDPLTQEAREVAAQQPGLNAGQQQALRDGDWDAASTVIIALAALRRGIKIAEARYDQQ
jgi:hypothetical protein